MSSYSLVNDRGVLKCVHGGVVAHAASQTYVFVAGGRVLVDSDPEGKTVAGCPIAPPAKLCAVTVTKKDASYSTLVFVDRKGVVLADFKGFTDGLVPDTQAYAVASAGQEFVGETR